MKSLDFLKEGFVEDASEAHQDHEVQMARQECFNTAENALALHKLLRNISEAQGLEGWVSSKITLANDYLKRVREYLEYEFLTKDINEITPQITIAENAESKKKLIEYKIVSGQEGKTQNYVITGLDTKTLDQLARAYYGAIKLEQDPKNPNVTTIIWDLPTAGPTPYGSYDAKSGTATFIKKMTDVGDQLAKSVKSVERSVEEGRAVSAGIDNISSAKKLWQYVRRNLTDLASNAEFYADLKKLYIEDKLSNLFKTADGQQVKIAFTTGGGVKFDQGILYIPIGVMWYYRGMYTSESFVNGVINALNGKQEMEEGLDLDQQAMTVADRLTSRNNLKKLQAMRHDSTVYRALDRYFANNNIPENIYNRVANIVFKRINQQGVAEGAPELLKKEMPLHRHAEKLLAQNGISKDDPDYQHHLANTIKHLRKFGNIDQINKQKISEGKEFGEGDIQRWAQKSPKNKEIYDEYEKVNQLAKKAWADKDGAAYTGLQNKRYYLRKLIGQKMSGEQGVAEGSEYTPPKLGTVKASIMNTTTPTVQIQVFKHNTLRGDSYWVTKQVKKFKTMDQAKAYVDRINNQGVAEGKKDPDELSRYENDVKTLLANGDIKTAKKVAGLSPDAAHRNHLRNIIRHYDSKQGVADGSSFQTDQMVSHISQIIKGLEGGGDKNTYMKLVAREMPHIVQSNPKLFRRAFGIAYDRFFHIDQDDDFDYTDDSMRQGEKGIAKGMDVVSVKEQGVAEGFDQEAGIGIDGKSFKFKIRDLVAFAEKYPVTKVDPNQFADQIAGREEDPAQSMARAEKADLQYPIIVVKRKNGQLWIADGTHRAHKAILNKLPAIQAKIIPIKDMTPFAVKQAVAEGSEKIFTVVYYSKRTDRTVSKPIKASSESELWDRLREKDIDVISVEEQGVAEDWRQDNYKQRGINSIMDLVTPAIREKKSLDGWISGIYNYIEVHNMENDPRWIRAEKNAKSMKTKWFIDNDMPTFNTNPKLARQGEVMFFKELIKNLANEFGQQGVAEQQDDPYRTNTEQNMDSVAQFEVGQKVIFTSPLNNKKYEAVVKNIWPDTGSIEVFIPLGDQGGGLGTFASPKNLQPMQQEVAEGKKCNHTMEGTQCPVHGLSECPMQENKKLKETSAGSVAGVNNPPGKNSGKKKSQIGSLFGGTYKQTVHETDFAGEKTTPPQKPGDQVRGTEKPIKKGKQQPFYHRLVGNE